MTEPALTDAPLAAPDSAIARDPGSYRDPGGFVYRRNGTLYRQIGASAIEDWEAFLASGLADRLIASGTLIGHETVALSEAATPDARAIIRPEPIEFISYPYEWTFGELQDAALLTLDAELEALAAGWTLKDASAYNVQFRDARPVLIDSLSFEPLEDGAPWVAYRQFCEHFLAPLVVMSRRDIRLSALLRADPDGIPLDLAKGLVPWRTRLNFGLLSHLHLHANAQVRHAGDDDDGQAAKRARISRTKLIALIGNLRTTVAGLSWKPAGTEWSDYADHTSYNDRATQAKERLVGEFVRAGAGRTRVGPRREHRPLQPDRGERRQARPRVRHRPRRGRAELPRRSGAERRGDILPLILDVANPSPGIGWANRERRSLLERADPDVILALALVHHLAISRNVPLPMVLELFAQMAPWAIVEFVPKDDPMVRRLLATRKRRLPGLHARGVPRRGRRAVRASSARSRSRRARGPCSCSAARPALSAGWQARSVMSVRSYGCDQSLRRDRCGRAGAGSRSRSTG